MKDTVSISDVRGNGKCKLCGYNRGCTTGYKPLTPEEQNILHDAGYELSKNVLGDEIATLKGTYRSHTARFALHITLCVSWTAPGTK